MSVDDAFYQALPKLRGPDALAILSFTGESLVHFEGLRSQLAWFNWTIGYDRSVFMEQSHRFLEFGSVEQYQYLPYRSGNTEIGDALDMSATSDGSGNPLGTAEERPVPAGDRRNLSGGELHDTFFSPVPAVGSAVDQWLRRPGFVAFVVSNCRDRSGRLDIARELMRRLPVDSFGRCLRNRPWPEDALKAASGSSHPHRQLQALLRQYKFVISVENSIAHDYVTEKLWDALTMGAIPIYLGAPNVKRDILPESNAAIVISDFRSLQDVANYVESVAQDRSLAEKHLAWHTASEDELNSKWVQAVKKRSGNESSECTVCTRFHRFEHHDEFDRSMARIRAR